MGIKKLRITAEPLYTRKKSKGICVASGCNAFTKKDYLCFKHRRIKTKLENPLRYWFDVVRQNARSRTIEFLLTIEEFKLFCEKTGYLELKGRGADNLSIDRKDCRKGYTYDNIQLLTLAQNSRKRWIDLKIMLGGYPTPEELKELYGDFNPLEYHEKPKEEPEQDGDEMPF